METKKEWKFFSIFNHEKEEEYLREMHKAGWKFVKVNHFGTYHFEKCPAEDVVYQLDYNKDYAKNKNEYLQMFSDCGWEYIQNYVDYSYFRKRAADMNGDEEIFCDDNSRMEMMERVYKGRILPLFVIFCAVILPQFINNLANGRYFLAAFMGVILGIYAFTFAYWAISYWRKKNG